MTPMMMMSCIHTHSESGLVGEITLLFSLFMKCRTRLRLRYDTYDDGVKPNYYNSHSSSHTVHVAGCIHTGGSPTVAGLLSVQSENGATMALALHIRTGLAATAASSAPLFFHPLPFSDRKRRNEEELRQ